MSPRPSTHPVRAGQRRSQEGTASPSAFQADNTQIPSASTRGQPRGQIKEAVSIRERPPEAEDRAVPGHWEGDFLAGSRNTHVATLVERSSRFVMLVRVDGKHTESVVRALGEQIRCLPKTMMATLTWDRGPEMAAHKSFTVATDVSVYFCDPKSPWQRGTSENTNRLLRQYLPRKTDLSVYDQGGLELIALKLNTRPRKTLGYSTPAATLVRTLAHQLNSPLLFLRSLSPGGGSSPLAGVCGALPSPVL